MGKQMRRGYEPDTEKIFQSLLERKEEHDRNYIRVKDEEMFIWFREEALPILKGYTGFTSKLSYEEDERGISVTFHTKELLLLPDMEQELMKIISRCSKCSIEPTEGRKLEISLWFRGWKEGKKPCSSCSEEVK